ncbi:hypothetical protein DM02DRAFT_726131 [Periconia macrospinosa]|uniref:Glycogen debranching enzyme n=1 Tax=Periconia macrospinosa TaxID=97972 RepID=A0A2V1E1B7_9PLEO|nr:hypothetical protein DM02DRAFT_726131 [Periconia macrospinosa]
MAARWPLIAALMCSATLAADGDCSISRLHLSEPPYENYILSDCHSSSHVIVTSPVSGGREVDPRLLIAWPSGSSGIAAYFEPENGVKGSLGLHLENSSISGNALEPVNLGSTGPNNNPRVGVTGLIHFDSPAILTLPIMGSTRTIRDYSEGGRILQPEIQNAVAVVPGDIAGGAAIYRDWLDKQTTTWLTFAQAGDVDAVKIIPGDKYTLRFGKGTYNFTATFNYPQMGQLSPQQVLNSASQDLISQNPDQTTSLSFLSYKNKILAGTWRFLTYFGRDSMISVLLMRSILSEGEGGAIEGAIAAVIERINKTDGTVCHEEVIGDYAAWLNHQKGIDSTAPSCDYKMVDTDYFLPIVMQDYFLDTDAGESRVSDFLNTKASFLQENAGTSYRQLAQATAEKIMKTSAPFASSQTVENLIHLNNGESVGEWRDSSNGLGGGRTPYDVNTALVPAGLRAIGRLARADFFEGRDDWKTLADEYAQVWEDKTLDFFKVTIPANEARDLVNQYVKQAGLAAPSSTEKITGDIVFHGLALNGDNNQPIVRVMNTDDCFRLYFLDPTNQTQLSAFLDQVANNILAPFPVGLSTEVGLFVANPAYGGSQSYADNWSNNQYHGTVVWSWQLAMMAAGLERQLDRCGRDKPDFCNDDTLRKKVISAYNHLWDLIDANRAELSGEVWSWKYDNGFQAVPFSAYSDTESDIRQLWSLTFLAVKRKTGYT